MRVNMLNFKHEEVSRQKRLVIKAADLQMLIFFK